MSRFPAFRFGTLVAALALSLSACSDDYPVVPQFSQPNPSTATTGLVTFPNDPAIVDILLSSCDETEIPPSAWHLATWSEDRGMFAIELYAGCYDIRVVREGEEGLVTVQQLGLFVNAGEVYV